MAEQGLLPQVRAESNRSLPARFPAAAWTLGSGPGPLLSVIQTPKSFA